MNRSQLELLVLYQDLSHMLQETGGEEEMGFETKNKQQLLQAREELAKKIDPKNLRTYERLSSRYKYSIAPVEKDTCLGCFAKLPTSLIVKGRNDQTVYTCEQCGRILYWIR
jgi:predicted  nucleic acid-binding Zn-ribbon protein